MDSLNSDKMNDQTSSKYFVGVASHDQFFVRRNDHDFNR